MPTQVHTSSPRPINRLLNQLKNPALTPGTIAALQVIGITTFGELPLFTRRELRAVIPGMSATAVREIQDVVAAHGVQPLQDLPPRHDRTFALETYATKANEVYRWVSRAPVSVLLHGDSPIVISKNARSALATLNELHERNIKTVSDFFKRIEEVKRLFNRSSNKGAENRGTRDDWYVAHHETPEYAVELIRRAFVPYL